MPEGATSPAAAQARRVRPLDEAISDHVRDIAGAFQTEAQIAAE